MGQRKREINWKRCLRKMLIILFWLLLWHLLAVKVDNAIMLVTPLQALEALLGLLVKVEFWQTVGMSLGRIGVGFLMGMIVALLLAALSSRFVILEEVLAPLMTLCKAVPVASFVVLLLIWWGSSFLAVAICFLIVLPNIYISTLEGLKSTDKKLLEMAKVFRMPTFTRFFYIYRPALKPFLDGSLKLSLGMCWKSGVAAEVIGTPDFSIGEQLYMSKIYLDTAGLFAWTAVIILLSVCFEKVVLLLVGWGFAWEPACGKCIQRVGRKKEGFGKVHRTVVGNQQQRNAYQRDKIEIKDVSKSFGKQAVIKKFSACYEPGQTYYLTSPSGSGKTTLLRIVCGLEGPDTGSVQGGERCSMVFQENRLCERYSALRNVEMVTGNRQRAEEALKQLLEKEALHKPCSQLSGGMKRRVALVRAMEAEADCVLLDEPFTGMDAVTRNRAEAYIKEKQGGRVLIIATHI